MIELPMGLLLELEIFTYPKGLRMACSVMSFSYSYEFFTNTRKHQ